MLLKKYRTIVELGELHVRVSWLVKRFVVSHRCESSSSIWNDIGSSRRCPCSRRHRDPVRLRFFLHPSPRLARIEHFGVWACDCGTGPVSVVSFFSLFSFLFSLFSFLFSLFSFLFSLFSFLFSLFSSFLSFFSHPDSCLKIKFLKRKSDVFGGARRGQGGPGEEKNEKRKKTKKNENNEKKKGAPHSSPQLRGLRYGSPVVSAVFSSSVSPCTIDGAAGVYNVCFRRCFSVDPLGVMEGECGFSVVVFVRRLLSLRLFPREGAL